MSKKRNPDTTLGRRLNKATVLPSYKEALSRLTSGTKLKIYWGVDPTGEHLHIGHVVSLLLLKDLAELGHEIIVLIGSFTARIGDPSGKTGSRDVLTKEAVQANFATYIEQISRVLPHNLFSVAYNGEWLENMNLESVLGLASKVTIQQLEKRDMFRERRKEGKEIFLNEFMYPLLQGFDSVHLDVDAEVGGRDQLYNMSIGRDLAQKMTGKNKMVLTHQLVVDEDSKKKMSKSEGNVIAINDPPNEIRRKVLNLGDKTARSVFKLCTGLSEGAIRKTILENRDNPQGAKEALAAELIRMFHGEAAQAQATMPTEVSAAGIPLDEFLRVSGAASSTGDARRLIQQDAVRLNGEKVGRWDGIVRSGDEIQVGKGKMYKAR